MDKRKFCARCKILKRLENFTKQTSARDGLRDICRTCASEAWAKCSKEISEKRRAWREVPENLAKETARSRKWQYKKKYGITVEDYDRMLVEQKGVCAICKGLPNGAGRYHVDHNHKTGEVRGLLCYRCNALLGKAKDDPGLLQVAIDYLSRRRTGV